MKQARRLVGACTATLAMVVVASGSASAASPPKQLALQCLAALRDEVRSYRSAHAIKLASTQTLLLSDLQAAQSAITGGATAPQVFTKFIADVQAQRGGVIFAGAADLMVGVANGTVPVSVVTVSPTLASTVTRTAGTDRVTVGIPTATSLGSLAIGQAGSAKPMTIPSGRRSLGAVQVQAYAPSGAATLATAKPLRVSVTFGPTATSATHASLQSNASTSTSTAAAPSVELDTVDPVTRGYERLPTTVTSNADGTFTASATTPNPAPFLLTTPAAPGVVTTYAGSAGEGPATSVSQYETNLLVAGNVLYVSDMNGQVRAIDLTTGYEVVAAGAPGVGALTTNGDGGPAVDAQLQTPEGLAMDAAGNLYIAEYGSGAIRKVDTNGIISTFASFPGPKVGPSGWVAELAFGPDGYLYATTSDGIARIDPTGAVSFVGNVHADEIAVDASGQMYASWFDDTDPQNPFSELATVAPDGTVTPLYKEPGAYGLGIKPDNEGHLLVTESNLNIVRSFDLDTKTMTTIAGNGVAGFSGQGGLATKAELWDPSDVAVDGNGAIYIADNGNMLVRRVDYTGLISTFAGNGTQLYSGDGGPATGAEFYWPTDVVTDPAGDLFVGDDFNSAIRKVDPSGVITTFASGIPHPLALALDASGNLYVVGYGGACTSTIVKVAPTGAQTTLLSGLCGTDGVAVDGAGDVYYPMDQYPQGIQYVKELRKDGTVVTIAGGGSGGDGGLATSASLNEPGELALDAAGNLYIADESAHDVRKVDTNGIITTVAGTGTCGFSGDGGPAAAAQLCEPGQMVVDGAGDLYIADRGNSAVRKVTPGGQISTVVGTGVRGLTEDGSVATATAFDTIFGLALDKAGDIFVTDSATVREIPA